MSHPEIFEIILMRIEKIFAAKQKPVRVAVNGIEGTGKTVFAEKLTEYLKSNNKTALHISIDGFHFDKAHRYRQGADSAIGYYEDSYNEQSFTGKVLIASQQDPPTIVTAILDLEADKYLDPIPIAVSNDTIIITDGSYLFKPVYRDHWDLKIYLKTDFATALQRGVRRDAVLLGGVQAAAEKYASRYHKASQIYIERNNPEALADMIIDNTDLDDLKIRPEHGEG